MKLPVGASSSPIGVQEFTQALFSTKRQLRDVGKNVRKIAIAVSGGVDSTALATLCQQTAKTDERGHWSFTALIVDHGARTESTQEAELVKQRMTDLGLEAEILPIHWKDDLRPGERSDFETRARELRYQALGRACWKRRIASLLLAHHEDDQAETVVLRIANGYRGNGSPGFQAKANIPECTGLYGVYRSGGLSESGLGVFTEQHRPAKQNPSQHSQTPVRFQAGDVKHRPSQRNPSLQLEDPIPFESGGIKIYRPLLRCSKERLVATCQAHEVKWIEDPTNTDVSLTQRNAVRQIMERGHLPLALQKPNLIALAATMRKKQVADDKMREDLFNKSKMLVFNLRSGSLIMRFRMLGGLSEASHSAGSPGHSPAHTLRGPKLLLQRVLELVSPRDRVELSTLDTVAARVFPEAAYATPRAMEDATRNEPSSFPCGGVLIQRLEYPIAAEHGAQEQRGSSAHLDASDGNPPLDPLYAWLFTRQPFARNEVVPGADSLYIEIPPAPRPADADGDAFERASPSCTLDWRLWDGRFWIAIENHSGHPVRIRALRSEEVSSLRQRLVPRMRANFDRTLRKTAPNKMRFTLPVIANYEDEVIALPTLKLSWYFWPRNGEALPLVKWHVRYKNVDLGKGDAGA